MIDRDKVKLHLLDRMDEVSHGAITAHNARTLYNVLISDPSKNLLVEILTVAQEGGFKIKQ